MEGCFSSSEGLWFGSGPEICQVKYTLTEVFLLRRPAGQALFLFLFCTGATSNSQLLETQLTTPSRTHCAAGFLGSSDTPVSCSSSWLTTSILVSASMRFCRPWRLSSGVSWKEWTWAVVMFRMWTSWREPREKLLLQSTSNPQFTEMFGILKATTT